MTQYQALLVEKLAATQVSEKTGMLATTFHQAIPTGRLKVFKKSRGFRSAGGPLDQERTERERCGDVAGRGCLEMVERELGKSSAMKPSKMKTVKTRRKFDETFKREPPTND